MLRLILAFKVINRSMFLDNFTGGLEASIFFGVEDYTGVTIEFLKEGAGKGVTP